VAEDGTEREPTGDDRDDANAASPPGERAEKPISFDFKLRLGSRESTASLQARATGELVQLQPIDWDSFTHLTDDDAPREYKTEGNLPSIIVELANQIAKPGAEVDDDDLLEREAPPEFVPPPAPDIVVATVEDDPMLSAVVGQILDDPAPVPDVAAAAPAPAPAAPDPAAAVPSEVSSDPPAAAPPVRAPEQVVPDGPIELPRIVALTPDLPSGETLQPPVGTPPALPATAPPPADATEPPPAARPVQMYSGEQAMAMAAESSAPVTPPSPAPAPVMPLQLAKIERKPGAERPTKPVDFHALLGQAGLQPAAPKRRKKRHPFRALFKLLLVLAILGAGLYFGKRYILDMRWDGEVKPFATDVEEARELEWKKAVPVETVPVREYAPHLVSTALGPDVDAVELGAEWRAMGLLEGDLDLDAVGSYAAAYRPVVYDPADETIYQLEDVRGDLRDFNLYQALTLALLDQHFSWSDTLDTLSPAERAARRVVLEGDASRVAWDVMDPSDRMLERLATDEQDLVDEIGEDIGGALGYPTDLVAGPGHEARGLFADDVLADVDERNDLVSGEVASDAALLDVLRGPESRPVDLGAPGEARGLTYWYYVLAGRIEQTEAWNAAVAWNGDSTALERTAEGECVDARISTVDEPGRVRLLGALQQWAAAAPAGSVATVTEVGTERIEVRSCDAGIDADTKLTEGSAFWGFGDFELLSTDELSLDDDEAARMCVVNAIRNFGVLAQAAAGDREGAAAVVEQIDQSCATAS
jgi:hypothetical protein